MGVNCGLCSPYAARRVCANVCENHKLVGTIVLVILLGAYAWVAVEVGAGRISHAPHWAQFAYFLMAGLLWVIPAGVLIRWMQRPD
ncbi:MAG: DUF2842 domain-containing protein [Methyloceanibacter sp.]